MDRKRKGPPLLLRLFTFLLTLALVLGALSLVVYRDRLSFDLVRRTLAERFGRGEESGAAALAAPFEHGGGQSLSLALLDDGILMASDAGMRYYSRSGQLYAEAVEPMDHPVLNAVKGVGLVYDAGGSTLCLCGDGVERLRFTQGDSGKILSARLNSAGWLAVTAQESGYKGAVTVYDAQYSPVFRLKRSSTFVVDAAVSPDCRSVAVVTAGQSGGRFQSTLYVYPLNSELPSLEFPVGNLAVLDLEYEGKLIWLLGENQVMTVRSDGSEEHAYSFGHSYLKGCSFGGDGFALLLLSRYRAGSAAQAVTLGPEAEVLSTLRLGGQVLDFTAAGRFLGLLSGNELDIYTQDFTLYRSVANAQGARYAALSDNATALLADHQRAWIDNP